MFATVGVPPTTATAPPLTRMVPAASRLTAMLLSRESPDTLSVPALNVAVTAAFAVRGRAGHHAGGERRTGDQPTRRSTVATSS